MVGIVIVSHSATLAEGVRELAHQMVQGRAKLATAGGVDDPGHPIGTDAFKVQAAIESVYSRDGVVVMMDLGSAFLSAETALEMFSAEQQNNIFLCEAPLVEGTLAATVQASVGATVQQVLAEARGALTAKIAQLGGQYAVDSTQYSVGSGGVEQTVQVVIRNRLGLHARPAAQFVSTANRFAAEITARKGNKTANAKSINQVAILGVRQGEQITVTAVGDDASAALVALQALVEANFGESETEIEANKVTNGKVQVASGESVWAGVAASPGVAIGPVTHYRPQLPQVTAVSAPDSAGEWRKLQTAVSAAAQEVQTLYAQAVQKVGANEAAIFEAHRLILLDPDLQEKVKGIIYGRQLNAAAAWHEAITQTADSYRTLEDSYLSGRAADVQDVGNRVLRHLLGINPPSINLSKPAILLAADLTPSDTARLDPAQVLGICTEAGGATSHSAILARALGIPAVVGLGTALATVPEGKTVAVDGGNGRFYPTPTPQQLAQLEKERQSWLAKREAAKTASQQPATTSDGERIEVAANIGGPHDTAVALTYGAEGVGLFRTEFLFLDRTTAPSEEEQYQAYWQVAQAMGKRPIIIRTLDVGGDKPLPYLDLGHEENPFLGWRGIRFCLGHPEIFKPQLRAILRASTGGNVKLMFPMIGTLSELRAAKQMLAEVQTELRQAKIPFDKQMEVGIMVEVPSAVAVADQLAREVAFFSIGSNDLTQYVMAADRGNAKVANLANALQPAVLRMIHQTTQAAQKAGIWVGMCGELAGNSLVTAVLIGLGVNELSMNAPAIPAVKQAIAQLTRKKAKKLAKDVLMLETAEAVQAYLQSPV